MIYKWMWLLLASLLLAGCHSIGPKEVHLDRGNYDEVVRLTDFQQVLVNIVRLRYVEPMSYLKVSSVTSSYSLSEQVSASPSWSNDFTGASSDGTGSTNTVTTSLGLSPGITFTDSPVISYTPIDSADFVTVWQTPIAFSDISLLYSGGFNDVGRLARVIFSRVGSLDNASNVSSPLTLNSVQYKKYYEFLDLLLDILHKNLAWIAPAVYNNNTVIVVHIRKIALNSPDVIKLRKILAIAPDSKDIVFWAQDSVNVVLNKTTNQLNFSNPNDAITNLVPVETRSIYGILNFLSHSVQVPAGDIKITQDKIDSKDKSVDWDKLMQGLMTIYSSQSAPKDAFVAVKVHGYWFYIKNSDLQSKATFELIMRLISLTGGLSTSGNQSQGPTLTLPVNG